MPTRTSLLGPLSAVALILVGCDSDVGGPSVLDQLPQRQQSSAGCDDDDLSEEFYSPYSAWTCDEVIKVRLIKSGAGELKQAYIDAVDSAAAYWNNGLQTTSTGHPTFADPTTAPVSGYPLVVVELDLTEEEEEGEEWCGKAGTRTSDSSHVEIFRRPANSPDGCFGSDDPRTVTDLAGLVAHELGHVYKFDHPSSALQDSSYIQTCIMSVPDTGNSLNHTPCAHEEQQVYKVWGFRDYGIDFNQELLWELSLTGGSDPLFPGDTADYYSEAELGPALAVDWTIADTGIARIASYTDTSAMVVAKDRPGESTTLTATAQQDSAVVWPWPTASQEIEVDYLPFLGAYEDDLTWKRTDQYLEADTSVGRGSHMRFHWRAHTSESWTGGTAADSIWDFLGHSSAGSYLVSYRAVNTTAHDTTISVLPVTVQSNRVVLSGDLFVTNKVARVYREADSLDGHWFERWNPGWDWTRATAQCCPQDTLRRIWPAGDYTVELREEVRASNPLERGRLHITRCHYDLDPCEAAMQGPIALSPPLDTAARPAGGIFGAGPWITWTAIEPRANRFYDLFGAHDAPATFETAEWLSQASGSVVDDEATAPLVWSRTDLGIAGAYALSFTIAPRSSGASYVFGFAVDPDLGADPADDRSGYDAAREMVYVYDADRAIGFLLRDGSGDALRSVQEFGVGRWAPATPSAAWEAQRRQGVHLIREPRDVQLVLSAGEVSGSSTWVVVIVVGRTVQELQEAADAVMPELEDQ